MFQIILDGIDVIGFRYTCYIAVRPDQDDRAGIEWGSGRILQKVGKPPDQVPRLDVVCGKQRKARHAARADWLVVCCRGQALSGGRDVSVLSARPVERAVIVANRDLGHGVDHGLANRRQPQQQPAEQIPDGLRGVVSHGGHHGEPPRGLQHLVANRAAFSAIAVEQRFRGLAPAHQRQLPGQIERILHAGVHTLSTGRAVHMRRVAGHEHAPSAIVADLAFVYRKPPCWPRDRASAY